MEANDTLPHLCAAFICEKVLEGKDGTLSAIRLIDQFFSRTPPAPGQEQPPVVAQGFLVVGFKAGDARGPRKVTLELKDPEGKVLHQFAVDMVFAEPETGHNIIAQIAIQLPKPGIYWFDVLVGAVRVTRIPIHFKATRPVEEPSPPPAAG